MPWKETCAMDQKMQMIGDWLSGGLHGYISEIYGISQQTAYKWIGRYNHEEVDGLKELSRIGASEKEETQNANLYRNTKY